MKRLALGLIALLASSPVWLQTSAAISLQWLANTHPSAWHEDPLTDNISFLRWEEALPLPGQTPKQKAAYLIEILKPALGLKEASASFRISEETQDLAGNHHLKFQYYHHGLPVFDGHLQFHFNSNQQLLGMDGMVRKDIGKLGDYLSADKALEQSTTWLRKHYGFAALEKIEIESEELTWFAEGQVEGVKNNTRLAYIITLADQANIREQIVVDARKGQVIQHYSDVCELAHRQLYASNTSGNPIWQDGDAFPGSLSSWQQVQVETAEEAYQLFLNAFGFESYDNTGSDMLMVDQASFLNCPNASWNGYSTNYCDAISTDDVVGHEWGHAYTEYTSHLLFAWQAGAINEAYSDIWGETIDILNSPPEEKPMRNECGGSNRWLIAESTGAFSEAIRDMWSPNCLGGPGKVSDPEYQCDSDDHGGVHVNSTVVSHAYAILVDGGYYNGYQVEGMGLTKAAHLFWHAQRYYLSRTSDFAVLADALTAAYLDLQDAALPVLSLTAGGANEYEYLTNADSLSLQQVIAAVELRQLPDCEDFKGVLAPNPPEICLVNGEELTPFFTEDFETGTDGWTLSAHPEDLDSWVPRHWALSDALPEDRSGTAAFGVNPAVGHCDTLPNNGILRLKTPLITVPADILGDVYLVFDHYFSLENGVDGGNVKLQQNGGAWLRIPPMAFLHNGYNDILPNSSQTDNPLAGDRVWTGSDIGSTTGSWGTTQINLSVLGVEAGESIRLRWELGTDGCDGWDGWYVDDIHVGSCALAALPVDWLSFSARVQEGRRDVQLDWQTTLEENNDGFYVERSLDGREFTELDFVPAALSAPEDINSYTYIDRLVPATSTTWYYRLRQLDLDGTISYSPLRVVTLPGPDWQILPNPATERCLLSWPAAPTESATVRLRHINGAVIRQISDWDTTAALEINLSDYPSGIYLLQIQAGETLLSRRLVVQ